MARRSWLSAFVRVRPFAECDFIAYHGTYKQRAEQIEYQGLRRGAGRGGIWLASNPQWAWEHAAWRAASDGCPDAPLTVLRIHIKGTKESCPIFRPVHPAGIPEVYFTESPIPWDRVYEREPIDRAAIERGVQRGRQRRRTHAKTCPPPLPKLLGRRRRRRR